MSDRTSMSARAVVVALIVVACWSEVFAQNPTPPPTAPGDKGVETNVDPPPAHTGWATLVKDVGRDFTFLPRRRSTWTFLAIGAAAALGAHPADTYVERHIVGNKTAHDAFMLGKWVGRVDLQVGTAVGLWAVGRYVVAPAADQPRTNKFSHLGFDLIR